MDENIFTKYITHIHCFRQSDYFLFLSYSLSRRTSMCKKADQGAERKSLFAKYFFKILEMGFNPFVPNAPFLYPLKTSKPYGFLMFAGRIERVHWEQMG